MLYLLLSLLSTVEAVCDVVFTSNELRSHFRLSKVEFGSRPVFFDGENYLFYKLENEVGHWVISDKVEGGAILGTVESFASHPVDIKHISPNSKWKIDDYGDKIEVEAKWIQSVCGDYDDTVHVISIGNRHISGFYQPLLRKKNQHSLYKSDEMWLYYLHSPQRFTRWMISHDLGSDAGLGYLDNAAKVPHATKGRWTVHTASGWRQDDQLKMSRSMFTESSFQSLHKRRARNIKNLLKNKVALSNDFEIPRVSLDVSKLTSAWNFRVVSNNKFGMFEGGFSAFSMAKKNLPRNVFAYEMSPANAAIADNLIEKSLGDLNMHYLDCVTLNLATTPVTEMRAIWRKIEHAYARAETMVVAVKSHNVHVFEKLVTESALPPHIVFLDVVNKGELEKYEAIAEEHQIHIRINSNLAGTAFDETRVKLQQIASAKRRDVVSVRAAWLVTHNFGVTVSYDPQRDKRVVDAEAFFGIQFDDESLPPKYKDEL